MTERINLEDLINGNLQNIDVTFEGSRYEYTSWLQECKETLIHHSPQFEDDWIDGSDGVKKLSDDPRFKVLKNELDILHRVNKQAYKYMDSSNKIRRFEYRLSSSGRGKKGDARILYALYRSDNHTTVTIYLAAISTQSSHHSNTNDQKALDAAIAAVNKYSKSHNREPS